MVLLTGSYYNEALSSIMDKVNDRVHTFLSMKNDSGEHHKNSDYDAVQVAILKMKFILTSIELVSHEYQN